MYPAIPLRALSNKLERHALRPREIKRIATLKTHRTIHSQKKGQRVKKFICSISLLLLLGAFAQAQSSETPIVEIFGGYSVVNKSTMHGWNTSVTINPRRNRWLGFVADWSSHYRSEKSNIGSAELEGKVRLNTFLFGPRVSVRKNDAVTPFVHALIGLSAFHISGQFSSTPPEFPSNQPLPPFPLSSFSDTNIRYAAVVGGGLDVRVNDHLTVRPVQLDYLKTQIPETEIKQNRVRFSAGLVIRF
jgi:opacity protein-like surface antigen